MAQFIGSHKKCAYPGPFFEDVFHLASVVGFVNS